MAKFPNLFKMLRKTPTEDPDTPPRAFSYRGGIHVSAETAMKVSAFYRGAIYLATQLAKLPINIKDKKNVIIADSKIAYLLNVSPNPETNAFKFKVALYLAAIKTGNAYAEIERNMMGEPIRLWHIDSSRVEVFRDPDTYRLFYRITGGLGGRTTILDPSDVFHLPNLHTEDGIVGMGVPAYAMKTLGISAGADAMASNLFANQGIPSGVLKTKTKMSTEAYNRLKESWKGNNGEDKSGGTSILEEGVEWEALNIDPSVLQFLESRKFGVIEIARFLGIPPTKLFDTGAATYSNVENANLEVATDTLDAWARNTESEIDMKLVGGQYGGKFAEMDLYELFRGDSGQRSKYFSAMMQVGAITPNEIRNREGMPGYADGDKFYIAVNNYTPADKVDDVIDAQIAGKTQPATPPAKPEEDEDDKKIKQAVLRQIGK